MASDLKELTHTLEIIQNKLKACQREQRLKLNKMTTKRALFGESFEVLQNSLGSSLNQDLRKKPSHISHTTMSKDQQLIPIIGDQFDKEEPQGPIKDKIQLLQCKGWLRDNRRVWIQVQALCLSNDIDQAHLSSIPNTMTETICVNSITEFEENSILQFYMTFDVLYDMVDKLQSLKVACTIDSRCMSSMCGVEWVHESDDATWKDQLLMSIPAAADVIQAYFPCCIQIVNPTENDVTDLLENTIFLNSHLYLSKDQMYIVDRQEYTIYLYGLNNGIVAKIASHFAHLSTDGTAMATSKELIKSLGKQCVTLGHNQLNETRLHTALLLSDMTK